MDLQLKGKKALVTGSNAGFGFATARVLAAESVFVIVNGRTQQRVDHAIAEIKKAHPSEDVVGIAADVSIAAGCAKLVQAVPAVDVLVNNMGIFKPIPFEQIKDEEWMHIFEANVMSGVRLSRLSSGDAREKLGPNPVRFERIGRADPRGNDSLRHDQNSAGGCRSRHR